MLSSNTSGSAIWTTKHHRRTHLPTRHIASFSSRIYDLIHSLHGEVESHKFNNRLQSRKRRTNSQTSETMLSDWRINHALSTKLVKQTLRNLICTVILSHLFANYKNIFISTHLFRHCFTKGFSDCKFPECHIINQC